MLDKSCKGVEPKRFKKAILIKEIFSHTGKIPQIKVKPKQNLIVTAFLKTSEGMSVAAKTPGQYLPISENSVKPIQACNCAQIFTFELQKISLCASNYVIGQFLRR